VRGIQRRDQALQQGQLARVRDRRRAIAYVELRKNPMQIFLRARGRGGNGPAGKVTAARRRRRVELASTARDLSTWQLELLRNIRLQRPMDEWPKRGLGRRTSLRVTVGAPLQNVIYPKLCCGDAQ